MSEARPEKGPFRRWAPRVVGTLFLLAVAIAWVDLGSFWAALGQLDATLVAALVGLASADRWLMAAKWRHVAKPVEVFAPFSLFLKAYYGSSFLSYTLPTSLGGDVYRGWVLAKGRPLRRVVASMAMERAMGLLAGVSLAVLGLVVLLGTGGEGAPWLLGPLVMAGFAAMVFAIWLSLHPRFQELLVSLGGRFDKASAVRPWVDTWATYRAHLPLLVANLAMALLETGLQILILFVAAREMGVEPPTLVVLSIISVARFVRRLSILLDGWGFSEALHILLFGWIGISGGTALAVSLLGHAVNFAASLPGAFLVWSDHREGRQVRLADVEDDGHGASAHSDSALVRGAVLRDPGPGENQSSR